MLVMQLMVVSDFCCTVAQSTGHGGGGNKMLVQFSIVWPPTIPAQHPPVGVTPSLRKAGWTILILILYFNFHCWSRLCISHILLSGIFVSFNPCSPYCQTPDRGRRQPNLRCRNSEKKRKMLLLCDQHSPAMLEACRNAIAFPDRFLQAGQARLLGTDESHHALPHGDSWATHYIRKKTICIFLFDHLWFSIFPLHKQKREILVQLCLSGPAHPLTHHHPTYPWYFLTRYHPAHS